jgi:hypothetical protein
MSLKFIESRDAEPDVATAPFDKEPYSMAA